MKVKIEISAKHIHLSQKDADKLFGKNYKFKVKNKLSQRGEFATKETVKLIGKKDNFNKVRIIAPIRKNTQIELSLTDCRNLGINAPIRLSGSLKGTPGITLVGLKGRVKIKNGVIVAKRHLHISPAKANKLKLRNNQKVRVKIEGERNLIFNEVIVRIANNFTYVIHLDTDEANAAGLKSCGEGELII